MDECLIVTRMAVLAGIEAEASSNMDVDGNIKVSSFSTVDMPESFTELEKVY